MSSKATPGPVEPVVYEGVEAVASCGDAEAEWALLDASAGVVDATWRRFIPATGEERRDFLHGQTTGNVKALATGQGCAAATLTAQGRPLALFALFESGDRIWIATTAAQAAATRAALSRFLVADDCDFEDAIDARCFTLAGPRAGDVLAAAGATAAASIEAWGVQSTRIAGQVVMLFSRSDLRVPGFDVLVCDAEGEAGDAGAVLAAIEAAGAGRCGTTALEILRVESGTARYGVDVDDRRIAMEARLEWAIHFAKGCYVGQEVVERAVSRGRINHELCLLKVGAGVAPGARVDGGSDNDVVTSVVESPRFGPLALAYLPRTSTEPGTAVTLRCGDDASEAIVQPWPRPRTLAGRN
jgi:folate-binding protein YgfZ